MIYLIIGLVWSVFINIIDFDKENILLNFIMNIVFFPIALFFQIIYIINGVT